jgi:hypothetical protein
MSREKLFLALAGLAFAASPGCTHTKANPDCQMVEKAIGNFKFRSCKESLDDKVLKEFELVAKVKKYAKDTFGFGDTPNYKEYRDGNFLPKETHYLLYVSPKNMLPDKWKNQKRIKSEGNHEMKVTKPTIFWSDKDDLKGEKEYYDKKGFETYRRSYNNYGNGCGLTPDLIAKSLQWRISVILHEDWHFNFGKWRSGVEPNINESAASFVGYVGAVDFIGKNYGKDSREYKRAVRQLKHRKKRAKFFTKYHQLLKNVFDSKLSDKQKDTLREKILSQAKDEYRWTTVMKIWDERPYTKNFLLLWDVYQKQGQDLGKMKKILRRLPGEEIKAIKYLKRFL